MRPNITFTQESFKAFKAEYEKHKDNQESVFQFEGKSFVVGFAKYLIEYVEMQIASEDV